jgi:hypothetical protein
MTIDSFPNAPRGPRLAGPIGDRPNLADIAPKTEPERFPRDVSSGVHAPSATLTARENFVEKLVPVLLTTCCKPNIATLSAVSDRLTEARKLALAVFDFQHGLTMELTPDEVAREKELAEREKQRAEIKKRFEKEAEARRLTESVDRQTRDKLAKFEPRSVTTQRGSPAFYIEKANYVTALNNERAAHGLSPLSV